MVGCPGSHPLEVVDIVPDTAALLAVGRIDLANSDRDADLDRSAHETFHGGKSRIDYPSNDIPVPRHDHADNDLPFYGHQSGQVHGRHAVGKHKIQRRQQTREKRLRGYTKETYISFVSLLWASFPPHVSIQDSHKITTEISNLVSLDASKFIYCK